MGQPSLTAVKTLFALSRNLCFFPGCEQKLTDPEWQQVKGQIAHICGENSRSARYDPTQSESDRQGYANLMLLCPNHHTEVDRLLPDLYPPELLVEIRERHITQSGAVRWTA